MELESFAISVDSGKTVFTAVTRSALPVTSPMKSQSSVGSAFPKEYGIVFFYTETVELDKDEQATILMSFIARYCTAKIGAKSFSN